MRIRIKLSVVASFAIASTAVAAISTDIRPTSDTLLSSGDGINRNALDLNVSPCEDFYKHACGGFIASHPASSQRPAIGLAEEQFDADLKAGLEKVLRLPAKKGTELARLQDFDASCRNGTAGDAQLVKGWLTRIDAVRSKADAQRMVQALAGIGVDAYLNYGGRPDRTNPQRYRGEIHPGILWSDEKALTDALLSTGEPSADAAREAKLVVEMLKSLRALRNDRWDAAKAENPKTAAQLQQLAPSIGWDAYLATVRAPRDRPINVTSIAYLRALDHALSTQLMDVQRAYLKWAFLYSLRNELPAQYSRAFADLGPNVRPETRDIDKRCSNALVRAMGVEFSRQYSTHILGVPARDAARRLSETIRSEIIASIDEDQWLSPEARRRTADKLRKTELKIGFPDRWPGVGHYWIRRQFFLSNVLASRQFEQQREWNRVYQKRSRTDWEMKVNPWLGEGMAAARLSLPNGFPDAFTNSLIMTAAFLSAPRFAIDASPELNAATYGSVFAHEFVHVAQLHMYGPTGKDEELWGPADEKAGDQQGQCVIDQANDFATLPGITLPGKDMFDENVADYGGARLAYRALAKLLGAKIDVKDATGTSPAQRFFYRFAQSRCISQTADELKASIANDGHAPAAFRVNAPLMNMPDFGRAFSCKPGLPMALVPAKQCRVW
jgi:putative endopeptidase